MRYLSVCSGIEAASVAWHDLGWEPFAFSELDPFPCAVLAHHYPNTPNLGDMTRYAEWPDATIDILVGGTPCQSFSVAGLRKGLDDPRGNLMLTYGAIAARYRPRWLVWENVPGVLSSNGGRDFGTFLGMLGELGYGFAYRVLDAQYFGVAQRRRRVFVVGCFGDWRRAAAILFERSSLQGDSAPRRESRKDTAGSTGDGVARCVTTGEAKRQDWETCALITHDVCGTLNHAGGHAVPGNSAQDWNAGMLLPVAHPLRGEGFDASEDGTGRGTPLVPVSVALRGRDGGATAEIGDDLAFSLRALSGGGDKPHVMAHAFDARQRNVIQYGDKAGPLDTDGHSQAIAFSAKDHGADAGDTAPTLRAMGYAGSHANGGGQVAVAVAFAQNQRDAVRMMLTAGALAAQSGAKQQTYLAQPMAVRRLTPRECERLQGFPDDYTLIPYRNKHADQCPDGPRYKALGNSMAVPVMRWIGERIAMVEQITVEVA